jgi:hypothetical protein
MSAESKIDKLIEENIFRDQKIDNPKIAEAIKRDYDEGVLSSLASSTVGTAFPLANPISGIYQGTRTGHPIAGFFGGKPATLGAASNNVKGIGVGDSFDVANVVGNFGIFAPVTAAQYGLGKLFGSRMSEADYANKLKASGIEARKVGVPAEFRK